MRTLVGIAAALLLAIGFWTYLTDPHRSLTTAGIGPANVANLLTITQADWRRDGLGGSVAIAAFGVNNHSNFSIRIETVVCRFRKPDGDSELRTSTTYTVIQPHGYRVVEGLNFGFIDAEYRSDCTIAKAWKV